jgi:aerobic-type carbon monoxide dehydrogenase small subunit (CoxS/CutS family)
MNKNFKFKLNGKSVNLTTESDRKLLWVLRSDLSLTGAKYGCGEGYCGACTVLVNREALRTCQISMDEVQGKEIVTIEGLEKNGNLHPIQKAFMEFDALQCGYCIPGMIMNAYGLYLKNSQPSYDDIIKGMDDNLCRCGSHQRIVQAIQCTFKEMKGEMRNE